MMYVVMLLTILPAVLFTAFTPYLTRKTESFGVSIPSEWFNHQTIVGYRKRYTTQTLILGIIYMAIFALLYQLVNEEVWTISYVIGVFVYLIVSFLIYHHFHRKMKVLKEQEKWFEQKKEMLAVDIQFYDKKRTYSNWWFTISFLIVFGTTVWSFANYDLISDRIPMQYNFEGEVTNWVDKSVGALIMFPLLQLFMIGLFIFTNTIIGRSKQQIDPASPEKSAQQNITFRRRWSLFSIVSGTALVITLSLPQLSYAFDLNAKLLMIIIMVVVGAIVLGALLISIFTGQGGSRINSGSSNVVIGKSGEKINRDDDKYWKLGIFYFNPQDPAVWIEKRFGSGWTANFARISPWIVLLLVIIIPILISLITN